MLARVAIAAAVGIGCGGRCPTPQAQVQPPAASDSGPHLQVILPHSRLSALATAVAADLAPIPIELPVPDALAPLLGAGFAVAITEVVVTPGPPGTLALELGLSLRYRGLELAAIDAKALGRPRIKRRDPEPPRLVIGFDADAIRRLEVRSTIGAAALAGLLKVTGLRGRAEDLAALGAAITDLASGPGGRAARRILVARLGEITRFTVDLPALPIAAAAVNPAAGGAAVAVDITTALPVERRLAPLAPDPIAGVARIRIAGSAVAALANWAVAEKRLPGRYDRRLRPESGGKYRPFYRWRHDHRRPLRIDLHRLERPCGTIRVGALPRLAVDGPRLRVEVSAEVEGTRGSRALAAGVWVKRLFAGPIEKSRTLAAGTRLAVGPVSLDTRLTAATIVAGELRLDLDVAPAVIADRRR